MIACINGDFLADSDRYLSIFDRCFMYGDGLFETVRIYSGAPFEWHRHFQRLAEGAQFLGIPLPFQAEASRLLALELIQKNKIMDGVLRFQLSRGIGKRGYSSSDAVNTSFIMTLHLLPFDTSRPIQPDRLIISQYRLSSFDILNRWKTCNRLLQVLARREAEAQGYGEALLLNENGKVAEAASANVFWIRDNVVYTPPIHTGILPGITRALVANLCQVLEIPYQEEVIDPIDLEKAESVFLTQSIGEIRAVACLGKHHFQIHPLLERLQEAYHCLARNPPRDV